MEIVQPQGRVAYDLGLQLKKTLVFEDKPMVIHLRIHSQKNKRSVKSVHLFFFEKIDPPILLTQPMDPEKKSLNFIFPTKYVIPKKFKVWPLAE